MVATGDEEEVGGRGARRTLWDRRQQQGQGGVRQWQHRRGKGGDEEEDTNDRGGKDAPLEGVAFGKVLGIDGAIIVSMAMKLQKQKQQ